MAQTCRHELKYIISIADAPALIERLRHALTLDAHAGENGEYFVRSLYFDDAYDSAYRDKVDGVRDRDKYRVRVYNLRSAPILLERKRKLGDSIRKDSVPITRRLFDQIVSGDPTNMDLIDQPLVQDMYREMRLRVLRPRVLVDYDREAYRHPVEHIRVTLDKRVRSSLHVEDIFDPTLLCVPAIEPAQMVLEVKYDNYLPDYIASLLSGIPARRCAVSKYALCRAHELG